MWQVWSVQPGDADIYADDPALGDRPSLPGPRRQRPTVGLDPQWAGGWLAFETPGEKRRLAAPWPTNWTGFSELELIELCAKAHPVRPSRVAQPGF